MLRQITKPYFKHCIKSGFPQINTLKTRKFSSVENNKNETQTIGIEKLINLDSNVHESLHEPRHIPVMAMEVVDAFDPKDNQVILDMTFGTGGHSKHLINAASVKLICLDRDPASYRKAVEFAKYYEGSVTPLLGRFSEMQQVFHSAKIEKNSLDGVLIDAGYSSVQMDSASRGFSISKNGPLDMRMDGDRYPGALTAADVLNTLDVPSLSAIFKVYGEEKHSKKIAQALFDARYMLKTINTTHELCDLVQTTLGSEQRFDKLQRPVHVATKVFQALRIFVNNELNELNYGLDMAYEYLKPGGRLVVLAFHSLEDRIVKRHILGIDMDEPVSKSLRQKYNNAFAWHTEEDINNMYSKKWTSLYKNVIKPCKDEVKFNPRSRSARLRAAIKNKAD